MAVTREFGNAENDDGDWMDYQEDKDLGKMVRLRVRRIPASVERQFRVKHDQTKVKMRDGVIVVDTEKTKAYARARAAYALTDSENFEHLVGDAEAAEVYSKLLGRVVTAGQAVSLDKQWKNDALKEHYLEEHPYVGSSVLAWVDKEARRAQDKAQDLESN
jgi:hypothetical protein